MRNKPCISALKTWLSSAFLLLSLFFVQAASAADYFWQYYSGTDTGICFSCSYTTPDLACSAYYESISTVKLGYTVSPSGSNVNGAPSYVCTFKVTSTTSASTIFARYGDSCPQGSVFDPSTGGCSQDQCQAKLNTSEPFSRSGVSPDGFLTLIKSSTEPPTYSYVMQQFGCFSGCKAEVDRGRSKCTARVSGPYTCRGEVIFDGTACAASEMPAFDPTADLTLPEPTTDRETKDCVFSTGPDGVRNCQISDKTDQAGQHCGEVNGKRICFDKVPQTDETKIDRQVKEEPTSDGGTKTTQTDTKTHTKCIGNKSGCTTSTTAKTTVTTKDSNGTTTGTNTSCQGASCTSNTNPDADGDGFGDCVGDDCGDGEQDSGSEVGGEGCDVSLTCSGDAIQCAILRKQKEQTCADEDFREVTPEKVAQLKADLESEFSGDSYQPLVADASNTFDFASTIDTSSRFSKSCPVVPDISAPWFEGQTLKIEFSDMISQFCDFLIWFGYLLVAFAMRAAAQIIANGMN